MSSCWAGLSTVWRLLCRRIRSIKGEGHPLKDTRKIPPGCQNPAKANVDYGRFDRIVQEEETKQAGLSVLLCGRKGWNSEAVNGAYVQDGTLNGRPRFRKSDGSRWLKFTDDGTWMVSRYPDGRALGEAWATGEDPIGLRSWHVCTKELGWEKDLLLSSTSADCVGCGKRLHRIHRCSQCRAVGYCSLMCQKADWRFHKRLCRSLESSSPEVASTDDREKAVVKEEKSVVKEDKTKLEKIKSRVPHWEEVDLLPWTRERLRSLLEGPDEREGLPALHVESRDGGHVEVVEVKNIEGLASAWKEHHLFDLSFKVVFKACWLSDFALMSMDGSVTMDFTSNLLQDEAVCGMSVDFAEASESCLDGPRKAMQTTVPPSQRQALQDALGANGWAVARGQGLMYLVHLRLRRFAQDFESK